MALFTALHPVGRLTEMRAELYLLLTVDVTPLRAIPFIHKHTGHLMPLANLVRSIGNWLCIPVAVRAVLALISINRMHCHLLD